MLGVELRDLVLLQIERFEFIELMTQVAGSRRILTTLIERRGEFAFQARMRHGGFGHRPGLLVKAAVVVEQCPLCVAAYQLLVFVLAVNLDQELTQLAQAADRNRRAVDEGAISRSATRA